MQFESQVRVTKPAISRFTEQVTEFLGAAGVDTKAAHHVALVFDEMLTNLATHGDSAYETAAIRVSVDPEHVYGEIVDNGPPFDPRGSGCPGLTTMIADRAVGGLGLHLVRQLTRALDYARREDRNFTSFSVPRGTMPAQGDQ